jgi:WD40 repeat protein
MSHDVDCPECGETLGLPPKFDHSKKVRCPDCDHRFFPSGDASGKQRPKYHIAKSKSGGMPKWVPFAIGGGVLAIVAVVAVVLIFALGGKSPKSIEVVVAPTTKAKPASKPSEPITPTEPTRPAPGERPPPPKPEPEQLIPEPQPVPVPEPVIPAVKVNTPALKRPAVMPVRIELPPLPPPGERPVLVLDPGAHTAFIKAVAFFPDGKQFATFSEDKSIRIWDSGTGLTTKTIHMPNGPSRDGVLLAGAVSPDGKWIATAGQSLDAIKQGEMIYLVSVETGEVERTFTGHRNIVTGLSFNANGKSLVSAGFDGTAIVFNVATGKPWAQLVGHKGPVLRARFHPKDERIVTCSKDGTARIWTLGAKEITSVELKGLDGSPNDVAWSPDGKTVATACGDGTIRTFTATGEAVRTYPKKAYKLGAQSADLQMVTLAFTRDGKEVVYGGVAVQGHAGVLNLESGEHRIERKEHSNTVMACTASTEGGLAITCGGDDNEMFVWRISDGSLIHKIAGAGRAVWAVGAGLGNKIIGGNTNRGSALPMTRPLEFAFDLERLEFIPKPVPFKIAQQQIGPYTVKQTNFTTLEITHEGKPYHTFQLTEGGERIYSASLVSSGRLLIGTSARLQLFDLAEKKVVRNFIGHEGIVTGVSPCPENGMYITGATDQTMRLWKADRDEPVLSLYFAGHEWIAWTPEGYYAASPGGERLMGWQVNNGHLKAGSYYSAIQFRQSLYQPDVIRFLGMAKGDIGLAVALAGLEKGKPIPVLNLAQVLPPDVRITSPRVMDGSFASDLETVEVTASARPLGKNPVRAMRLLVDGRPYQGAKGIRTFDDPKLGETTAKWTVALTPGRHSLMVQADTGRSKGLSVPVQVAQAGEAKKRPTLYVFAVGVNDYPAPMKLNFATSDANAIAAVLNTKGKGVFEKVDVELLTDAKATRAEIMRGLDRLERKMTADDVGIFYFSGHGARDEDGTFYLVPVDVDARGIARSCVPGEAVKDKLAGMPGKMLAVFDACHSGAATASLRGGGADDLMRELLTDDCGVIVICSSMGDEYSLESNRTKAGFFTYGLVEGLNGSADFNNDGYVHIHEATAYAAARVKALSDGAQNPTVGSSPHLKPFALTKK